MDDVDQQELAGTVGTDVGRADLLQEIVGKVDGLDISGPDDDLDRWWGAVEADRLASGLTLATIAKLAEAGDDKAAGPWLQRSDETGDELTALTPEGRVALRSLGVPTGPRP